MSKYYIVPTILGLCAVAALASMVRAQEVGDVIPVKFACTEQAEIEKQIDTIYANKDFETANDLLRAAVQSNDCGILGGVPGKITELGKERGTMMLDGDDDVITIRAFKVEDAVWTAVVRVVGKGT